jgi:hypothetical protein
MIGCGHADECMARGIANWIRLGLDDPTAGSAATVIANDNFADQETRQLDRVLRQLRTTQSANTANWDRSDGVAWIGCDVLPLNWQSLYSLFSTDKPCLPLRGPAFERYTGIANALGRNMREIAPDHERYWFENYGEIALTGQARRFEASQGAADNRWFDFQCISHPSATSPSAARRRAKAKSGKSLRARGIRMRRRAGSRTRSRTISTQIVAGSPASQKKNRNDVGI